MEDISSGVTNELKQTRIYLTKPEKMIFEKNLKISIFNNKKNEEIPICK